MKPNCLKRNCYSCIITIFHHLNQYFLFEAASTESAKTMDNPKVSPALPLNEWINVSNLSGKYVKMGEESDVEFVESCACNDKYDLMRNDGNKNIYIPVIIKGCLVILSWAVNGNSDSCVKVMNVVLADGTTSLSCYGSKLSDSGILWMCIFNLNLIVGCCLTTKRVVKEFVNIPAPNDLCLSKDDPDIIYVACGTSYTQASNSKLHKPKLVVNKIGGTDGTKDIINVAPFGRICSISIGTSVVNTVQDKVNALAGIECAGGKLVFTQLYDMCERDVNSLEVATKHTKAERVWYGTDVGNGKFCYLADNISVWGGEGNRFLSAIYRKLDAKSAKLMENRNISALGWFCGKLATIAMSVASCNFSDGLDNPELALYFSEQDEFKDCCFLIFDAKSRQTHHYKFPPPKKAGVVFDGHVTHTQKHGDKLIFVNFMSNNILVLDDSIVPN
jgi:hypothetical protein